MASTVATDKLFSNAMIELLDFAPGGTSATLVGVRDLRDYGGFAVIAMLSTKGGTGLTAFEIIASAKADGSTPTVVKSHALGTAADAVGDYVCLECSAEEIAQLGSTLRYVSARGTMNNASDEATVCYVRHKARWAYDGLTADAIAA